MLRAAEAMMLGFIGGLRPVAGVRTDGNGGGCALGAIEKACGRTYDANLAQIDYQAYFEEIAEARYPWLNTGVSAPWSAGIVKTGTLWPVACIIAQTFNERVMGDHSMTIEQLAEWIDSVDPTPREAALEVAAAEVGAETVPCP